MKKVIHTEELTKTFAVGSTLLKKGKKTVCALDRVSLDIGEGEIVGLVGESGSGKTTMARVLLGLTPATSGVAEINGKNIVNAGTALKREIRSRIAVVFQDPASNLNPRQTVEQSIIRPLLIRGIPKEKAKELAKESMTKVQMDPSYLSSYPHQLSGGQQQRIAIARAIVMDPKIMILDEPTSALDISVQAQVLNLLLDLQEEYHLTYLVITHDMNVIRYIADKIAVMYMGRLVEFGTASEILENPKHPYTVNLEKFVPVLDPRLRSDKRKDVNGDEHQITELKENACILEKTCPYATERCRTGRPQMRTVSEGHTVSCFRSLDK